MIALDTETTGLDLRHGAKPFLVTTCDQDGEQICWEWPVDPLTREPKIPKGDLREIRDLLIVIGKWGDGVDPEIADRHSVVGQNIKFDVRALKSIGVDDWPWEQTHDTLMAGHLLASNQPHDLTSMTLHYLGIDIEPLEKTMEKAVQECRRKVQQARLRRKRGNEKADPDIADWRIAQKGQEEMPSAKEKTWKIDTWLPRAYAAHLDLIVPDEDCEHEWGAGDDGWACQKCSGHRYWTVTREYANADSAVTVALWAGKGRWPGMARKLRASCYWPLYEKVRRKMPWLTYRMEERGVTLSGERLEEQTANFTAQSERAARRCLNLAAEFDYELTLPKSGNNRSLISFCFDVLKLPVVERTDSGAPSLNAKAMDAYVGNDQVPGLLEKHSTQRFFIESLSGKRKCDTAIAYMTGYRRFWLPIPDSDPSCPPSCQICGFTCVGATCNGCGAPQRVYDWHRLHPNLNPTGTDTLRFSSNNPNSQNLSKKDGFNLRYLFGPAPGREQWSFDAKNIERRLPAYEAGEEDVIALLERPDDPPYFGSEHLLVAHVLYPKEFEECCRSDEVSGGLDGRKFKKKYSATYYDRTKRFNFAMQYNCGEKKGDATSGVPGSWRRVKVRFIKSEKLNQHHIQFAEKHGYVETMPDREVCPEHGYPIWCSRTEYGRILSTVPLNYHVQGTACWWMMKAMIRCQALLDKWRAEDGFDGYMILQVHDELVFDFPRLGDPEAEKNGKAARGSSNLRRARAIRDAMAEGGNDLIPRIPTPVSINYHPVSYKDEVSLDGDDVPIPATTPTNKGGGHATRKDVRAAGKAP